MYHWLLHFFGVDNPAGPEYAWWSGAGSDIAELAIIGGLISIYRKHNCVVSRCWRVGKHPVARTTFVTCRRHHPDDAPTHQDVLDAHNAATGEQS